MNKQEIYDFLKNHKIHFEVTEHPALFSMDDACDIVFPYPECDAKNLFVRDDKKRNYYLITVKGSKRVDLNDFRLKHNTRRLSFASAEDLKAFLKLTPGSVTPFGLLNDEKRAVFFFIDEEFKNEPCFMGIHPNDNTATVWINVYDLLEIIKEHGNEFEFANLKLTGIEPDVV